MRRITPLSLCCTLLVATLWAHAESVTPETARALAASTEQTLVELNSVVVDQYFHQGQFEQCVTILNRVIELNPIGTDAYSTITWLLWSTGRSQEAIPYNARMVANNPTDPDAYFQVGVFYVRLKNDEEAVKWLAKAVELGLPSPQRHMYGLALTRLGRNAEALAFWQRVLADDPKDAIARREIDRLNAKLTPAPTDDKVK
ncbi:MAG TPA: tetratricopeptide repeat protein [Armatimonadota bacterium]|jgi:tetratricopeptide (TPR) repeat protein